MKPILNLGKISKIISEKIGEKIVIDKISKIGSGYHSDGFRLQIKNKPQKTFFLKRLKSYDLGFEHSERRRASLLVSNFMAARHNIKPRAVGVFIKNNENFFYEPPLDEESEIYQIQEFESGKINYWQKLLQKKNKKKVDENDEKELLAIVDLITKIHSKKYPWSDIERKKAVYNSSLRDILCHPELTLRLLQDFPDSDPVLAPKKQKEYVGLMLKIINQWKDRQERLVSLHGDFWGTNVFFRTDYSVFAIDYSRIPWGDPGIDIGWWVTQYLWFFHKTGNSYFKKLGEKFLAIYEEKTSDGEIRKALAIPMGFLGVVYITPKFYPDLSEKIKISFFDTIKLILEKEEFLWNT